MKNFLIIENQPVIIAGLTAFLSGEFSITEIDTSSPDYLTKDNIHNNYSCYILGINPNSSDNDSLIQNIFLHQRDAKIIVFSNETNTIFAKHYLKIGVKGFISKNAGKEEFNSALHTVLENKVYLSDEIKYALTNELVENKSNSNVEVLSKRELEVTSLLAKGLSNGEISNLMHLHTSSVGTYKSRIFEKLNIRNVIELRQYAQMNNLIAS